MKNFIPKAIAYSRDVRAIENHSYQAWLAEVIKKEDLIAWSRRPEVRQPMSIAGLPSKLYGPVKKETFFRRFVSQLIP